MQNQLIPDRRPLTLSGWPEQNDLRPLIEAAWQARVLDERDIAAISGGLLKLLGERYAQLRVVESSSLPREAAERLLESCLYLIGLPLRELSPEDAVERLRSVPLTQLLLEGRAALDRKIRAIGRFLPILQASALPIAHSAYQYAQAQAHRAFFSTYDADWGAHELNWTPAYMPCLPLPCVGGILYLQAYLEALHTENMILGAVPGDYLQQVLASARTIDEAADPDLQALTETIDPDGAMVDCNLCALLLDDLAVRTGHDAEWVERNLHLRGKALRYMQRYLAQAGGQ